MHFAQCVAAVALLAAACGAANTADLPIKQLTLYATHVFTGKVTAVEDLDVANEHHDEWSNRHYRLTVAVDAVLKTQEGQKHHKEPFVDETIAAGTTVDVMAWRAQQRPDHVTLENTPHGGVGLLPGAADDVAYVFYAHFLHRDQQRRQMYHDSYPHQHPTDADGDDFVHARAYNVLMPNGILPFDRDEL
jgi:hypothetical protein